MSDETLVFEGNRGKAALLLLVSLGFVAIGAFLVAKGDRDGWWPLLFFSLCALSAVYMLLPGTIRLQVGPAGIEMKTLFKPMKLRWEDVESFHVARLSTSNTKLIGIRYAPSYQAMRTARAASAAITGMEGALPNHFDRPAEELCRILNECKRKWGTNR
jgi:hypothetical protein